MQTDPPSLAEALAHIATNRAGHAWSILVGVATDPVLALACRLTGDSDLADDVLQETLLAVLEQAPRFQPRDDPDRDALRWILALAAHRALRLRRDRMRARRRDQRGRVHNQATAQPGPDETLGVSERHQRLHAVLDALDEPWRTALTLRYLADLGYNDIASSMRVPVGTAKTHVHRGLERLRRCLPGGLDAWSGVALAEMARRSAHEQPSNMAPRAHAWMRTSLVHGGVIASTASALVSGGLMTLLCVAALAVDAPAPPAASADGGPAPLIQLVPISEQSTWSLKEEYGSNHLSPETAHLLLTCALQVRPADTAAGFHVAITEARTDTGALLICGDAVDGRREDQDVTLTFSAPPLGARRLSLRGTLDIDLDDAPPEILDVGPLSQADGRWFGCADHPSWFFQLKRSNGGCDLLLTSAMLRALGTPVFYDQSGHTLSLNGTGSWSAPRFGQVMASRGFYLNPTSGEIRLSIPLHAHVHVVRIPVVLDDIPLRAPAHEQRVAGFRTAPMANPQPTLPASEGVLPCADAPGPAPGDASSPLTGLHFSGYAADLNLQAVNASWRASSPGTIRRASADVVDLRRAMVKESSGYQLDLQVPSGHPSRILAVDEAVVTDARTDSGEALPGYARGTHVSHVLVDNCSSATDAFSISTWTQLPWRAAGAISQLHGLLLAEGATAAPRHLRLAPLHDHLGRWLSAPGNPACALRITLLARDTYGMQLQVVHIERTPDMALVLRTLSFHDARGVNVPRFGSGGGYGAKGTDYIDLFYKTLPDDLVMEGDLFLSHAAVEVPFTATDLDIAVPSPPMRGLSTEHLPDAAVHPTVLALRLSTDPPAAPLAPVAGAATTPRARPGASDF